MTTFDLVEPLGNAGRDGRETPATTGSLRRENEIAYEHRDEELSVAGDVAFGRTSPSPRHDTVGRRVDMWFRETLGYRKEAGTWKIVHQHSSVPLDMKTMKGMLDLKPPAG